MTINFDKTGEISSFTQQVRGEKRVYRPQDIIHLNTVGFPYGVSISNSSIFFKILGSSRPDPPIIPIFAMIFPLVLYLTSKLTCLL